MAVDLKEVEAQTTRMIEVRYVTVDPNMWTAELRKCPVLITRYQAVALVAQLQKVFGDLTKETT